jgi:hypothetical protein
MKHRIEITRDYVDVIGRRWIDAVAHDPTAQVSARSRRYDADPQPDPWLVSALVSRSGHVEIFRIHRVGNLRDTGLRTARGRAIVADVRAAIAEVSA